MISRIGIAALLYFVWKMGALGCWYGDALAGFMPVIIGGIFFLSGKWKTPSGEARLHGAHDKETKT